MDGREPPNYYSTTAGSLIQTHSFAEFKSSNSFIINKKLAWINDRRFIDAIDPIAPGEIAQVFHNQQKEERA